MLPLSASYRSSRRKCLAPANTSISRGTACRARMRRSTAWPSSTAVAFVYQPQLNEEPKFKLTWRLARRTHSIVAILAAAGTACRAPTAENATAERTSARGSQAFSVCAACYLWRRLKLKPTLRKERFRDVRQESATEVRFYVGTGPSVLRINRIACATERR